MTSTGVVAVEIACILNLVPSLRQCNVGGHPLDDEGQWHEVTAIHTQRRRRRRRRRIE